MLLSVGMRPTFEGKKRAFEAHLMDYQGNLYGKEICLEIEAFVRRQMRLKSPEALVQQIKKDIKRIKKN
jgi:riboflavin kinase / FMN adenylyltransferase